MSGGMFEGNKYLHNKILGDGFGFDRVAFEQTLLAASAGFMSTDEQQETEAINGNVHNGPISAIRTVGYVGLAAFIVFLVFLGRYAWQLINQAKRTPYFLPALFFGLPLIYKPLGYLLIFGAYDDDLRNAIIGLGMLKLLNLGLEEYRILDTTSNLKPIIPGLQPNPHRPELGRAG